MQTLIISIVCCSLAAVALVLAAAAAIRIALPKKTMPPPSNEFSDELNLKLDCRFN